MEAYTYALLQTEFMSIPMPIGWVWSDGEWRQFCFIDEHRQWESVMAAALAPAPL